MRTSKYVNLLAWEPPNPSINYCSGKPGKIVTGNDANSEYYNREIRRNYNRTVRKNHMDGVPPLFSKNHLNLRKYSHMKQNPKKIYNLAQEERTLSTTEKVFGYKPSIQKKVIPHDSNYNLRKTELDNYLMKPKVRPTEKYLTKRYEHPLRQRYRKPLTSTQRQFWPIENAHNQFKQDKTHAKVQFKKIDNLMYK